MPNPDWTKFDTILLDMDGTVLDLAYDNHFWRELVPRSLATQRGEPLVPTRADLFTRYAQKQGQLDWYCLDFWSEELGMDLHAMKSMSSHRIRYLPGAREFLAAAKRSGKHVVLVTNAHGHTLAVKRAVAGLDIFFEHFISSHDLGFAKEQPEFWPALQDRLAFDVEATLFIDDSVPVLDAASRFGIRATVAIRQPDSREGTRETHGHKGIDGLSDLLNR